LPAIGAGAAHARRSVADVALVVPVFVAVGTRDEDVERQRAAIRALIAFYGSTRTYRAVFELHGWPDLPSQLHEMQSRGDSDGMTAVVTDEILDTVSVTASWDGLAPLLRDRYEGIAARVMPYSVSAGWRSNPEIAERWRAVATELHASDGV
ncbi:MAG TPA: LLM class flavin-dependent oxidoreductase, partial [Acidimicrobiales bacterium]|nr:LLM class flavin-dependent oxidoreductase [Acidimicrobiales bacterium]